MCSQFKGKRLVDVVRQRIDILDCLLDEEGNRGVDKRTLVERLDCSRSTVDRSVRELASLDLVTYDDGEYRPTTLGLLVVEEYRDFEERVETLERLEPALEWFPADEFGLDVGCLSGADVIVSTPNDPYAPANHHADVMAESESFRGLLPAVGLNQLEVGTEAVMESGHYQTLVVESGVAEQLRSKPHYAEKIDELLASGRVEIMVTEDDIPYFLGLYDETVHVGVDDEDGMPRALIETSAEEAREWAESVFADFERRAHPFAAAT